MILGKLGTDVFNLRGEGMNKCCIVPFSIAMLMMSTVLWAQDNSNQQTIEDVYLQSSIEVQVIATQASQDTLEMKLIALDNIRDMVDRGAVSESSLDVLSVLRGLGAEGTTKETRVQGRLANNFPMVRKETANLLGEIGGDIARDYLIEMIRYDYESMVISEAIYAMGRIGIDEEGTALDVIADAVRRTNSVEPDDNLAFATLLSYERIAEQQGGIKDPDVFESIILIAQGNYIRDVKKKAVEVLDKLRKFN